MWEPGDRGYGTPIIMASIKKHDHLVEVIVLFVMEPFVIYHPNICNLRGLLSNFSL